jgi:hypothetical protein
MALIGRCHHPRQVEVHDLGAPLSPWWFKIGEDGPFLFEYPVSPPIASQTPESNAYVLELQRSLTGTCS